MSDQAFIRYENQVRLLIEILPLALKDARVALKGGTAINLFLRELPRLSIDIDLTYLPIEDRQTTLTNIDSILRELSSTVGTKIKGARTITSRCLKSTTEQKILVELGSAVIKVEVNSVMRGSVFAPQVRTLSDAVQRRFGSFASVNVMSFEDIYAGKMCAALDRQHPRDWFDVLLLLRDEGIREPVKQAFLVYLMSHNRPMSEILDPRWQNLRPTYEAEFKGMTIDPITLDTLEHVRHDLLAALRKSFTDEDKSFLVAFKEDRAKWDEFFMPKAKMLPAIIWKQQNLRKMDPAKRKTAIAKLISVLDSF